jgi:hypothetical protein
MNATSRRGTRPALAALVLGFASLLAACNQSGGPNVAPSFRVVLLEPTAGSTNVACNDTIHVTFNHSLDTTAVYDELHYPHYFLAGIQPPGIFDSLGVTLSNPETDANGQAIHGTERTLNLPFTFAPATNYTFNFDIARNQDGQELETRASTVFQTAAGPPGCP